MTPEDEARARAHLANTAGLRMGDRTDRIITPADPAQPQGRTKMTTGNGMHLPNFKAIPDVLAKIGHSLETRAQRMAERAARTEAKGAAFESKFNAHMDATDAALDATDAAIDAGNEAIGGNGGPLPESPPQSGG